MCEEFQPGAGAVGRRQTKENRRTGFFRGVKRQLTRVSRRQRAKRPSDSMIVGSAKTTCSGTKMRLKIRRVGAVVSLRAEIRATGNPLRS